MLQALLALLASLQLASITVALPQSSPQSDWQNYGVPQSPDYPWLFHHPVPVPHEAKPLFTEKVNGRTIHYFELTIEPFDVQVYPHLGPAHFVGYSMYALDRGRIRLCMLTLGHSLRRDLPWTNLPHSNGRGVGCSAY